MKKTEEDIRQANHDLDQATVEQVLQWALDRFGAGAVELASSLGAEDQVLTHIIQTDFRDIGIFTLDTGRLHQATYDTMHRTAGHYRFQYQVLFPDREDVEALLKEKGPNSFYESVENRKECCHIRKVKPLMGKLRTLKAWITGLRRSQAVTREALGLVEWDAAFGLVKINPLARWSEQEVWDFIKKNHVPYNALHDQGYPSIGCLPCTRPVAKGEDIRAGRWWWESPEHKECGLHRRRPPQP